jgi:hypothetical protein
MKPRVYLGTQKMEATNSSYTPLNIYQPTRRHIPEDSNFYSHRRGSVKSHKISKNKKQKKRRGYGINLHLCAPKIFKAECGMKNKHSYYYSSLFLHLGGAIGT